MPDWAVQSPVSTVRPTPPRPKAATGGGGGSPHSIGILGDSFGVPSWSTLWSNGSTSRSGGTITLAESGIWHVSFSVQGSCEPDVGFFAIGGVSYGLGGGVTLGIYSHVGLAFCTSGYFVDQVAEYDGSGGIDLEVSGSATVSFNSAQIASSNGVGVTSNGAEHVLTAHWVGP